MKITVTRSAVIDAPIEKVWALLRDFNSHRQWHPAVAESLMENDDDGDVVGGVRRFSIADGGDLREQLLRHSDRDHALTYGILDASLPLIDYVAIIRLRAVTDGDRTFWHWRAGFSTPRHRAKELENLVAREIFEAGFIGMGRFLAEQAAASSASSTRHIQSPPAETVTDPHLPIKAVVVNATGAAAGMSLQDGRVPPPSPRQLRIRQTAVGVNPMDLMHGRRLAPGQDLPGTPGLEGVGEIIDVGEQVIGLFPGDRITYVGPSGGAYADIRCIDADVCMPIPKDVSDTQASTLLNGVTVALLLSHVFRVGPGATILMPSVTGGLGHILSQWAKSMGLTVIGTVASVEKARISRDFGCSHPIVDTAETCIADDVMRITNGRGVDAMVHTTGAHGIEEALACLATCGHVAVIEHHAKGPLLIDIQLLKERSLTLSAPDCFDYLNNRPSLQRLARQYFSKIQSRAIVPVIETYPLNQANEAHRRIAAEEAVGAVTLIPGQYFETVDQKNHPSRI